MRNITIGYHIEISLVKYRIRYIIHTGILNNQVHPNTLDISNIVDDVLTVFLLSFLFIEDMLIVSEFYKLCQYL